MNVESDDAEPVSGQDAGAVPAISTIHWSGRPARWGLVDYSVNGFPSYASPVQIYKPKPE